MKTKLIKLGILIFLSTYLNAQSENKCKDLQDLSSKLAIDLYPEPGYLKQITYSCYNDTLEIIRIRASIENNFKDTFLNDIFKFSIPFNKIVSVETDTSSFLRITTSIKKSVKVYLCDKNFNAFDTLSNSDEFKAIYSHQNLGIAPPQDLELDDLPRLANAIMSIADDFPNPAVEPNISNKKEENNCNEPDSVQLLEFNLTNEDIKLVDKYLAGIENEKLVQKAKINGSSNLKYQLDSLLNDLIGDQQFRSNQFKICEINLVVTDSNTIENLYLTSELFWFLSEEDRPSQFSRLSKLNEEEVQMTKSMMGYIAPEVINSIKTLIKEQTWESGICNGNKVHTIVNITLNDL